MRNQTIIYGAPGCGKTHYLLTLLEDLLTKYKPYEIAFVSFTRAGAYEGKTRAIQKFGYKEDAFPFFRTLHSLAFQHAHLTRDDVVTRKQYYDFSNAVGMKFSGYYTEDFTSGDDIYLFYYFLLKNNAERAKGIELELNTERYKYVERLYNKFKLQRNLMDYTDMVEHFVQDREALPVKVAIIDEAQDLTTLQWQMCEVAFRNCEKVFIAGDDDQAVYEWNGADVEHFLGLQGERVILDKSYRMPSTVLSFARQISDKIENRVRKEFAPRALGGDIFLYNSVEELPITLNGSWYLLARNNAHLDLYRNNLMSKGILFSDKGDASVQQRTLNAIRGYEHRRQTGKYRTNVEQLIVQQMLKRGADTKLPWYEVFDLDAPVIDYIRQILANNRSLEQSNITVSTFHGVKGGEADDVVVLCDFTKRIAESFDKQMDSELRCLYVGCTRAKKNLHIVFKNNYYGYEDLLPIQEMTRRAYVYHKDDSARSEGTYKSFNDIFGISKRSGTKTS